MEQNGAFLFLCNERTERECLAGNLVGATMTSALWAACVRPGDEIYLFNYEARRIFGPFSADSGADSHDSSAWGGGFPLQIRIVKTPFTRRVDNCSPSAPTLLLKRRPSGEVGSSRNELYSWLQATGTVI